MTITKASSASPSIPSPPADEDSRPGSSTRMSAHAMVSSALRPGADGRPHSYIAHLRSETPLKLFTTLQKEAEPWAAHAQDFVRICLAASAAGPIGGDHLSLDVHVGAGSTLVLTEVSATLLLPGRDGTRSRTDVRATVDSGGTLVWLPEPVIAASGCHHRNDIQVQLAQGARLFMREELILGRHGEGAGQLQQRTFVQRAGRTIYAQDLEIGTDTGTSPAVAADNRALGSLLMIDPALAHGTSKVWQLPQQAAIMPLVGGGVLVTALGTDSIEVRRQLNEGLRALGPPWDPHLP